MVPVIDRPTALFVLAALPVLLFLAIAVPLGEVPDEVAHILRADSVRHGAVAGWRAPRLDAQGAQAVDVVVRAEGPLMLAGFVFLPGTPVAQKKLTAERLAALLGVQWVKRLTAVSVPNTGTYPPTLYLPAALTLEVAKRAWLPVYVSIVLGRLTNALLYVLIAGLAVRLGTAGRGLSIGLLCLPMCLWLGASMNQDGLLIALAALAGSLLTRGSTRCWALGTAALGVAVMAKPFLLPLTAVVLAWRPPGVRWRVAALAFAGAALPSIAWTAWIAAHVAAPFVRGPAYAAGPLWPGAADALFATTDPAAQLAVLRATPSLLWSLPLASLLDAQDTLWREFVGVLGTLDVKLPDAVYQLWAFVLGVGVACGLLARPDAGVGRRYLVAGAAVGAVWLMYLAQYLSWTYVGAASVEGVQGRYFLPIAVLALPCLVQAADPRPAAWPVRFATDLVGLLCLVSGVALSLVAVATYYAS